MPIYIGYERHGSGHLCEKNCAARQRREPAADAERLEQKLRSLGQGYVSFGEPMPLMTYPEPTWRGWRESIDPIGGHTPSGATDANSIAAV